MRLDGQPEVGGRVRVLWGRWANRVGVIVRYDRVHRGGGRSYAYPVVRLDATGRAVAREVRVLAVEPERS